MHRGTFFVWLKKKSLLKKRMLTATSSYFFFFCFFFQKVWNVWQWQVYSVCVYGLWFTVPFPFFFAPSAASFGVAKPHPTKSSFYFFISIPFSLSIYISLNIWINNLSSIRNITYMFGSIYFMSVIKCMDILFFYNSWVSHLKFCCQSIQCQFWWILSKEKKTRTTYSSMSIFRSDFLFSRVIVHEFL